MRKPIAITCGDPTGVGPELTVKAWQALKSELNLVLFSSFDFMKKQFPDIPMFKIERIHDVDKVTKKGLPIFDIPFSSSPKLGELNNNLALETIKSIQLATNCTMNGETAALCTNPINKFSLMSGANFNFTGHTDYLKHLTGSQKSIMMIATDNFRVIPLTVHSSLKEAIKTITKSLIRSTIEVSYESLRVLFNIRDPKIYVSGLNPHAGENGMLGNEEIDIIKPAIDMLVEKKGWSITGPLSADTMFYTQMRSKYDLAVCMYHDQALIPIKTVFFNEAINITLGLPIIRTSPDHGTAHDIAGKNLASPTSLINAIRMAKKLTDNKALYENR